MLRRKLWKCQATCTGIEIVFSRASPYFLFSILSHSRSKHIRRRTYPRPLYGLGVELTAMSTGISEQSAMTRNLNTHPDMARYRGIPVTQHARNPSVVSSCPLVLSSLG